VAVQFDVRHFFDVAVRRQHTLLVFAAEERNLDLLALVLVRVVLDAPERSENPLSSVVVAAVFAAKSRGGVVPVWSRSWASPLRF
jgi:hypothetical protein